MDIPLEILDREVASAAARLRAARAALARGEASGDRNPLEGDRRVSSRATYLELLPPAPSKHAQRDDARLASPGKAAHAQRDDARLASPGDAAHAQRDGARPVPPEEATPPRVSPADALRDALREWLYALTLERVLWADTARIEAARRDESVLIEHADLGRLRASPRALLERVLAEPADARRRLWAEALERGSVPVADAARIYEERRAEAARRLPAEPDLFEIPCAPKEALAGLCEAILRRTEPLTERATGSFADAIGRSVGRSLGEGWPARLVPRWLDDLFRATGLTEGLRLDLGPLPAPIGASSFARALAAFGGALADADGPRGAPFSLAFAPFDLRRARRAALFGSLPADPVFGARSLGLGRGRARDQAREIGRSLLTTLRLLAVRVLLRGALALPESARASRFEERTAEALGAPIPPSLAGVVPRLAPGDAAALAGALLAARDRRALIERFDEDWFRSPHAARAIREEDGVVPSRRATAKDLEAGLDELARALEGY